MPLTRFVADALGVVTICLVALLVLLGLLCILYSFYFRTRIRSQGLIQLGYFSGPWIIRIAFVLFAIWWGLGEIFRLNLLSREGSILKWRETVCKCYIVWNLGFAEPCLFLALVFLLRASLQKTELGTLSRKWNGKTVVYVLLYCLPVFVVQLIVILVAPQFNEGESLGHKLPHYFTSTSTKKKDQDDVTLCTYPLLSTIFLGLFATVLTTYLFWLGRRILSLVINKGLQKRVYTLIFSVSAFFPLRVLLLGLSVLSTPEHFLFEVLVFLAFLSLLCCAGVSICMLVYCPVADSLALRNLLDIEARRRISEEHNDILSLIANQRPPEESIESSSPERDSVASAKRGSISFRTMEKDETSGAFVELSLFSPSQHSTPPGSPRLIGWPMLPPTQVHGP
ncbi:hypothetical protein F0562_029080 [Nyssa sinensis]|uniref:G-protein coupled receptors family 2 profile 2 domain-containing protein n=1 Tax=Nyssa sinensis TaxID=561372 RepID=A0A5J5B402_9ASTE|nr:hypothetical protein F0562_029080 [Nyssa sinensis]